MTRWQWSAWQPISLKIDELTHLQGLELSSLPAFDGDGV